MKLDRSSPGQNRLKVILIIINIIFLITGVILTVLGLEVDLYLKSNGLYSNQPPLWWAGILPCACGIIGIPAVVLHRKHTVIAWVVLVTVVGLAGYVALSVVGCLEPGQYGVHVEIFGHCKAEGWRCTCFWEEGLTASLEFSTCSDIHQLTSLYISLIVVLIVCLSCGVTGAMLGCVTAYCLPGQIFKRNDEKSPGFAGANYVKKSPPAIVYIPSPITEECEEDLDDEGEISKSQVPA